MSFEDTNLTLDDLFEKLISTPRSYIKEYIQTTKLDQCALQATSVEQYFNLEITLILIYIHLHFGAVMLVLILHGRKGLLIIARVSLLDFTLSL